MVLGGGKVMNPVVTALVVVMLFIFVGLFVAMSLVGFVADLSDLRKDRDQGHE